MTAPNRATLWGETIVDELVAAGVESTCLAPGSRSTPLTVAFADHAEVETFSILDERSAAFFALGRGRRSGEPTALVCTSGTAAANFHPAVIEASQSRVPLVVLTADRPAELHDSGANQTVDQSDLYGDAPRYHRTLPEPAPEPRRLRSLRATVARAVSASLGPNPGPVHLNVPFAKPLEPTPVPGDVPEWDDEYVDRVSDRLMFNFDLEKEYAVDGQRFTLYGKMQMHHQKHFFHPLLSFAHPDTYEHVFVRRQDGATVADLESLVDLGHDLADEWIDADEEHYATEFTFAVVADDLPEEVASFVRDFRDRTLIRKGYYGHYEIHLLAVDPDGQRLVESRETELGEAFRLWEPIEREEVTWWDLLRRRLQV